MAKSSPVTVVAGPAGSGKTSELLEKYCSALSSSAPDQPRIGSALWICPTGRNARSLRERIIANGRVSCFEPGVTTFARFADQVLEHSSVRIQSIPEGMKRELLSRLIAAAVASERLPYFRPIAETDGFLDQVAGFISELKRLEIWPEHFIEARRAPGFGDKDFELGQLYAEYQALLVKNQLYDDEGRFWEARDRLEKGQTRPFENVAMLVVDGFTDFTRTQHEMLQIMAGRVERTFISLPLEKENSRPELFHKSAETLRELERRHKGLRVEWRERKKTSWAAWSHLERKLFSHPATSEPLDDFTGIEIVPAARQEGEIEYLARTIKRMILEEGIPPQEIVVVFRRLTDVATLVRETFREFGIPFVIDAPRRLLETPCLLMLVNVLRLVLEDWPYRRLLALVGSNFFVATREAHDPPADDSQMSAWPRLRTTAFAQRILRELQVSSGRARWFERIKRTAEPRMNEKGELVEDVPAIATLQLLHGLQRSLEKLPKSATPSKWATAIQTLAIDLGVWANCDPTEKQALETLLEIVRENERLSRLIGEPIPNWNLKELTAHVETALQQEITSPADETGCVRVISAASVRSLSVPYLFVAGLAEQSFPPADRDDRLYSETEGRDLIASGLRWVNREERSGEELLLFYEVVTRATKRLVLSYPALDEKAQPLSASPYLSEILRVCGEKNFPRRPATDLNPLSLVGQLLSPTDRRLMAVAAALPSTEHPTLSDPEKFLAGLARQVTPLGKNLVAALHMQKSRHTLGEYGTFEGMLTSAAVRDKLSQDYGDKHCWSPSRLEQYAKCPHQFYLDRVLNLKPLPEISLELDHSTRGGLLHAALATLHRRVNSAKGEPTAVTSQDPDLLRTMYLEIVEESLEHLRGDDPISKALTEIDRRTLLEWGENYLRQAADYEKSGGDLEQPPVPAHFEVAFGPDAGEEKTDPISTDSPCALNHGKETILFSGRIDRIDTGVHHGQNVFNIVDYKSGKGFGTRPKDIEAGVALQLPLYAIAAEELLLQASHAIPWRLGYWFLKKEGFTSKKPFNASQLEAGHLIPDQDWLELKQKIVDKVVALVRGIRAAQFPMHSHDDECTSRCEFSTVCRVQQTRSLRKQWLPPTST